MASGVNFGTQQYFNFDPRTIPGCVLWMDGADATTLTLSGSSVTQWRDKSGSAASFTTVNGNPTYTASLINGLPGIDLTNATGFISSATQTLTSSLTMAMILVVKSGIGAWGSFFTHGQRDLDVSIERNSISTGTTLQFQTANDNSGANLTFTTDQVSLYLGTMTTGTSRFFERFGGGTTTTTTATNSSTITPGLQTIRIGRSDVGENCNSYIGEVVYFNRVLSTSERQQLEAYLAWKWGLQASLPISHPYKAVRPIMRNFQPVDLEGGALLWLDAADTRTITGSTVTQWTDKSGRASNATTGLGSVVAGTAINSLNTLRFGYNTTLNLSNFVMPSSQTSVFYVIRGITRNTGGGGTGYFILSRTADNFLVYSGNEQFFAYQNIPAGRSYIGLMGPGGERNWGNLSTTAFFESVNVISTTGVSYASSNGLSLPLVRTDNISNTIFTATTYQISTSRACCGDVYTYDLGELVVCDGTVSIPAAQQMEGYLAWKWGVQRSLPTTHPYYNVLPSTPLFVPTSFTNCALWFDAADASTTVTSLTISFNIFVTTSAQPISYSGTLTGVSDFTGGTVVMNGAFIGGSGSTATNGLWAPSATSGRWYSYVIDGSYCKTVLCEFVLTGTTLTVQGISTGFNTVNFLSSANSGATNDSYYATYDKVNPIATSAFATGYGVQSFVMNAVNSTGTTISTWQNKGTFGGTASGGVSPTRGTNGVVFNGTSQYLATTYSAVPTAETFFGVATWTGTTDRNYCIIGTSATNGRNFNVQQYSSGAGRIIKWDRWGVAGYAPTSGVQPNVQFLASGIFTGSAGQTAFNGGNLSSSASFSFAGSGTTNIGAGVLGDYFAGTINEVIVYSSVLTDSQRQRVEGYLAWKWGLRDKLPDTHPYYKFRP